MLSVFLFIMTASALASLANFFLRKNLEVQYSAQGYFLTAYACSFLASLNFKMIDVPFSVPLFLIGSLVGCLIVLMMTLTAKALTKGPAGFAAVE